MTNLFADCANLHEEIGRTIEHLGKTNSLTEGSKTYSPEVHATAEKKVAELLAKASTLFLRAIKLPAFEECFKVHSELDFALRDIAEITIYTGKELRKLMFEAHGTTNISLSIDLTGRLFEKRMKLPIMKFSVEDLHWLQVYNAMHWAGIAEFYGFEHQLYGTSCHEISVMFDEQGLLHVSPELIQKLIRSTPHLIQMDMQEAIPITVSGSATMSLLELFALLRTASNSIHSISVGILCSRIGEIINDRNAIERGIKLSKEEIAQYVETPKQVRTTIRDRNFREFNHVHFKVLLRAVGYQKHPNIGSYLSTRYHLEETTDLGRLLSMPKKEHELKVELSNTVAIVTDTGIGSAYVPISEKRSGGRTSGFLQRAAADIRREIRPDGCTATVKFRRAMCG